MVSKAWLACSTVVTCCTIGWVVAIASRPIAASRTPQPAIEIGSMVMSMTGGTSRNNCPNAAGAAMERTAAFKGLYFVLMGRLSPLDGVGPRDIGVHNLLERASDGVVQEVILATSFTAEGEATAHAIGEALKRRGVHVTRLARGVPVGSELEYVDLGTIAHALADRR